MEFRIFFLETLVSGACEAVFLWILGYARIAGKNCKDLRGIRDIRARMFFACTR